MDENVESDDAAKVELEQEVPAGPGGEEKQEETKEDKNARLWTVFCHLSAFAIFLGVPFGNIIGPLVIWLIKKDEIAAVDVHGKNALNFQISMTIYILASSFLICGGPLVLLVWFPLVILNFIFTIVATINASDGKVYSYPMSLHLIK